jgi:hypothetical protein
MCRERALTWINLRSSRMDDQQIARRRSQQIFGYRADQGAGEARAMLCADDEKLCSEAISHLPDLGRRPTMADGQFRPCGRRRKETAKIRLDSLRLPQVRRPVAGRP